MKIFSKFLFTFLALSLIPLLVISGFVYREWTEFSKEAVLNRLEEVLQAKIDVIEQFLDEIETDVNFIARTTDVAQATKNPTETTTGNLDEILGAYSRAFGLEDAFIVRDDGEILYSLKNIYRVDNNIFRDELKDSQLERVVRKTIQSQRTEVSDYEIYPVNEKPLLFVSSPIIDGKTILGTLVFAVEGNRINKIFSNYRSLGKSGEVLIGRQVGNKVVFVNSIRHDRDSAFTRKVEIGSDIALPMQEAVRGHEGKEESIDYRDVKILAVWDYFPKLNWGMVAKIDLDEALEPVNYLRDLLLIIATITILIVIIIAVIIARVFAKPIHSLSESAEKVGEGNFEAKCEVQSKDEFGQLAQSFNKMVDGLKESTTSVHRLNEEIAKRDQAEKMRSEMLSRISHELRTPLTPIQEGIAMVLSEKEGPLTQQQKELLQLADNNVKRLADLVASVLHIQEPSSVEKKASVDLKGILSKIAAEYRNAAESKQLHFATEISQDVPSIEGDPEKIEQAIKELVDNAIKFTEKGDVVLSGNRVDNLAQIIVKDTGKGIPKEEHANLFEPFREFDMRHDEKVQGKGLGLVFVKKVAESHGGSVQIESGDQGGCTFIFTLQIKDTNG